MRPYCRFRVCHYCRSRGSHRSVMAPPCPAATVGRLLLHPEMLGRLLRILITGGAGFIGSNLARLTLARDHDVIVLDDLSTGFERNLKGLDVRFIRGSILDEIALAEAVVGVDSIVHLAALGSVPRSIKDPVATHLANASGTLAVLEAARAAEMSHVVVASSSSVYGMNPALPKSEREWVRPMSPYAVTKLATEQYPLAYQQSYGMRTVAFRFFNVYGPLQAAGHAYAAVIPTFVDALLAGESLLINGDGTQSRDFTFVGTVCHVLLNACERLLSHPEPVNLAFGTNTTLLQLVAKIEEVSGLTAEVAHRQARPGDVKHSQADNAVLRSLFPDVVPLSLEQGLTETIEWFKELQ
jgi:UDP-glucose 4-epimerase